jgi:hypothetical protein
MPTPISAAERATLEAARATLHAIGRRATSGPTMSTLASAAGMLAYILQDAAEFPPLEWELAALSDDELRQEDRWLTARLLAAEGDEAAAEADLARLRAIMAERERRRADEGEAD